MQRTRKILAGSAAFLVIAAMAAALIPMPAAADMAVNPPAAPTATQTSLVNAGFELNPLSDSNATINASNGAARNSAVGISYTPYNFNGSAAGGNKPSGQFDQSVQLGAGIAGDQNVPGWKTAAGDQVIEIWQSGFQTGGAVNYFTHTHAGSLGAGADGSSSFMAEINGAMQSSPYQDLSTTVGSIYMWSFRHAGRTGADTARMLLGAPYTVMYGGSGAPRRAGYSPDNIPYASSLLTAGAGRAQPEAGTSNRPVLEPGDAVFTRQFFVRRGSADDAYLPACTPGGADEALELAWRKIGRKDGIERFQDRSNADLTDAAFGGQANNGNWGCRYGYYTVPADTCAPNTGDTTATRRELYAYSSDGRVDKAGTAMGNLIDDCGWVKAAAPTVQEITQGGPGPAGGPALYARRTPDKPRTPALTVSFVDLNGGVISASTDYMLAQDAAYNISEPSPGITVNGAGYLYVAAAAGSDPLTGVMDADKAVTFIIQPVNPLPAAGDAIVTVNYTDEDGGVLMTSQAGYGAGDAYNVPTPAPGARIMIGGAAYAYGHVSPDSDPLRGIAGGGKAVTLVLEKADAPGPAAAATPAVTPAGTPSGIPTETQTTASTVTPKVTQTATSTTMPKETQTATPTATPAETQTAMPTVTPAETQTATPNAIPKETPKASPSATPVETPTATPSVIPAKTQTATPTATPKETPKAIPSATPTTTPTASPVATPNPPYITIPAALPVIFPAACTPLTTYPPASPIAPVIAPPPPSADTERESPMTAVPPVPAVIAPEPSESPAHPGNADGGAAVGENGDVSASDVQPAVPPVETDNAVLLAETGAASGDRATNLQAAAGSANIMAEGTHSAGGTIKENPLTGQAVPPGVLALTVIMPLEMLAVGACVRVMKKKYGRR
ncbi:MAG: hypothetical protein FWF44_00400 [Defluviitaleaceae bacterium]|nr:hypothetical protein [Defluviitaleaceae bacterium]